MQCGNHLHVGSIDHVKMGSFKDIPVAIPKADCRAHGALDVWMRLDLTRRFDAVAGEPLPEALTALLSELA